MKNIDKILQRAKREVDRQTRLRDDRRIRSVMAYLIRKGLLISNHDFGKAPRAISAADCIFSAENFEPRIYAVLPAVVIHFPKAIKNREKLPAGIRRAVEAIRKGEKLDLEVNGIPFREMDRWARNSVADKRVRPVGKKKIVKTFRLSPRTIEKLTEMAKKSGRSLTYALEAAVLKA